MDLDNPGDGSTADHNNEYWTDEEDGGLEETQQPKPSKSTQRAGSRNFSLHRIVSYWPHYLLHDI